jgi:hypothetical protein
MVCGRSITPKVNTRVFVSILDNQKVTIKSIQVYTNDNPIQQNIDPLKQQYGM